MLEKSFELLELLIKYPNGLTMQETVNLLNTPKTTVFRLLNSLLNMGYLSKNIDTQQFFLSKKFLKLGLAALGESNIVEQSLSPMRALRDKIKESIMLGVFMENRIVLLEQVLGSHNFTFLLRPGTSFCLHASPRQIDPRLFAGRRTRKSTGNDTIYRLQQTYYRKRSSTEKRARTHSENRICSRPGRRNGRCAMYRCTYI